MKFKLIVHILLISSVVFLATLFLVVPYAATSDGFILQAWNKAVTEFTQNKPIYSNALPENEYKPVRLTAVGDIMLSRTVATKMYELGANYPFEKTNEYLASADLTFGNLETSVTPGRLIEVHETSFRADPDHLAGLQLSGFDILSLANNHTPDWGVNGLYNTFTYLKTAELPYVGAGKNLNEALQFRLVEKNGIVFAFLAFNDSDVVPPHYEAAENRAGTAFMRTENLKAQVSEAKKFADFIIVSMHSGTEYVPYPNSRQTEFAHTAIDAGADLVLGHHPHVIQTMEVYNDKLIFYSLGNFIFDQMWSQATRESIILTLTIEKSGVTALEIIPIRIDNYAQAVPISAEQGQHIIDRLQIPDQLEIPVSVHEMPN